MSSWLNNDRYEDFIGFITKCRKEKSLYYYHASNSSAIWVSNVGLDKEDLDDLIARVQE